MNKDIILKSEQFGKKTILLPQNKISDCYSVYSKEEFTSENINKKLFIENKAYKHRLYFYKKLDNKSKKVLTFIILNPGFSSHLKSDNTIKKCEEIAKNKYGAIEIISIFTLRTVDKIDAIIENTILDVTRMDLSKNDIVLAYGDNLRRTNKHKNLSHENLSKINKVRSYKIIELLKFLSTMQNRKGKTYIIGLTPAGNPKTVTNYKGEDLIEFVL